MNKARKIPCFTALALTGLVAACSDAVPPAAQGAASFHVSSPAMAGDSCPATPHWSNAPFVANMATTQTVTLNQKGPDGSGPLAVDGQSGAQVKCSVVASGDKFIITGRVSGPVPGKQPNQFTVSTTLGPNDTMAAGTITVVDDQTGSPLSSSACVVAARPTNGGDPGVAAGKVWASATCTGAGDLGNAAPNARCDFTPAAVFVFENCAQ
jgi:hypothetical protein